MSCGAQALLASPRSRPGTIRDSGGAGAGPGATRASGGAAGASRECRGERGQLTVLFGLGLFTLLLFVALTVNIGQAVVRRHQIQLIADNSALTGAAVQARGLNFMTEVNATNMRLFNMLSVRSRVGGYHAWRMPLITFIADIIDISLPSAPAWPDDEKKAFEAFEPFFTAGIATMHGANFYYMIQARRAAWDMAHENVQELMGNEVAAQLGREGYIARPPMEFDFDPRDILGFDLEGELLSGGNLDALLNLIRVIGGDLGPLIGGLWGNMRPLIPNFANFDGDELYIRYWTDMSESEKQAWAAAYAAIASIPCAAFFGIGYAACYAAYYPWFYNLIVAEGYLRWAMGPAWHEMKVTLHRAEDAETFLIFWARIPTTRSTLGTLIFADLPSMVAFSAAKPVGGNFGTDPVPDSILGEIGGLGEIVDAISGQPSEHCLCDRYRWETPPRSLPNIYWYEAVHMPTYRPRLAPIKRTYLAGSGFSDLIDAIEELGLPEDFADEVRNRMIAMYQD